MLGSMIIILLLFIVTTAFVEVDTDKWQDEFFNITLVCVIFMNIASAILAGGLFGIAGQFSSEYMTAVVSGQALGGIFAALCEIISLTFGVSTKTTALVYFMIGNFVLLISLICYVVMSRTLYFKYHTEHKRIRRKSIQEASGGLVGSSSSGGVNSIGDPSFKSVLSKIWLYGFSEWLVFVTTLSIYPAVTVLINSQNKGSGHPWNGKLLSSSLSDGNPETSIEKYYH